MAGLRDLLAEAFGGEGRPADPTGAMIVYDPDTPFTVVADQVTADNIASTAQQIASRETYLFHAASNGINDGREFVFGRVEEIPGRSGSDDVAEQRIQARAEQLINAIPDSLRDRYENIPGTAFLEISDSIVSFTLQISPANLTIDEDGVMHAFAIISPTGTVKSSYVLMTFASDVLNKYFDSKAQ